MREYALPARWPSPPPAPTTTSHSPALKPQFRTAFPTVNTQTRTTEMAAHGEETNLVRRDAGTENGSYALVAADVR
jgi:hypothetical protein